MSLESVPGIEILIPLEGYVRSNNTTHVSELESSESREIASALPALAAPYPLATKDGDRTSPPPAGAGARPLPCPLSPPCFLLPALFLLPASSSLPSFSAPREASHRAPVLVAAGSGRGGEPVLVLVEAEEARRCWCWWRPWRRATAPVLVLIFFLAMKLQIG